MIIIGGDKVEKEFKKLSDDSMFKAVFSDKKYMSWLLKKFLGRKIEDYSIINKVNNKEISNSDVLELIKQELVPSNVFVRKKTVDLLVKRENEIIDIEVNNIFDENVRKRNYAYLSNVYSNFLKSGQEFEEQPNCTQINICNGIDYDFDNYCLLGEKYNNKFIDNINFLVYDVAKYKKMLYTDNKKLIKKYAHIIMFDCDKEELELLGEYDEMVKEIGDMVKKYNDDNIYNFLMDEESCEKLQRAILKTAKKEAHEQGLQQGIDQGIEQGIEQNKIDTVCSLLKENIPLDIISRTTGYPEDYLQTFKI